MEARAAGATAHFDNLLITPLPQPAPGPALTASVESTARTAAPGTRIELAVTLDASGAGAVTLTEYAAVWTACAAIRPPDAPDCTPVVVDWSRQPLDPPLVLEASERKIVQVMTQVPGTIDCRHADARVSLHLLWRGTDAMGREVQVSTPHTPIRCIPSVPSAR